MQMPTSKILFNQVDNRSIKEIKLSTVWKHVVNDNSKAVKTLLVRMAEVVNIHYRIEIFVGPKCHSNANISAKEKINTFQQPNWY